MSLAEDNRASLPAVDGRARALAIATALRRAARKSSAPVSFVSGGGGFRARKGDRLFWRGLIISFVVMVVAPFLAATIYFGLIASKQFVTDFQFSLRDGDNSALGALSGLGGIAASQQAIDSQVLINFIPSRAMMEKLDAQLDLRRIYSRDDVDGLSRFNPRKTIEDLERYWYWHVDAWLDGPSSTINVHVLAFTPEDSYALAKAIKANCDTLVNELTQRARDDALRTTTVEFDRAKAALDDATKALRDARNAEGTLDASATALGIQNITAQLEMQLARLQQQRAVSARYMTGDSTQMKIIDAGIENLRKKISETNQQVASPNGKQTLADSLGKLGNLQTLLTLAQKRYANAAVQYESARIDVESQHAFLVDVSPPSQPQKALYPRRLWSWFLVVFPSFILWSALAGLAFMVRDHTAQ